VTVSVPPLVLSVRPPATALNGMVSVLPPFVRVLAGVVVGTPSKTFVGSLIRVTDDLRPILYAVLSLTVIRMVPVAISLIGSRLALPTVAFIGWFGPRGLASIVFGILAVDALAQAGTSAGPLASTVAWTVLFSVVAHGLTAGALAARYGRWIAQRQETSADALPELEERSEPRPATRSSWIRRREPTRGSE
jgi:NhaP-type Na+/H+ or K+/H+ antiporter